MNVVKMLDGRRKMEEGRKMCDVLWMMDDVIRDV